MNRGWLCGRTHKEMHKYKEVHSSYFWSWPAVAVATGMQTEMGHITGMREAVPQDAILLQKELPRAGELLAVIVVAIAVIMLATSLRWGGTRFQGVFRCIHPS